MNPYNALPNRGYRQLARFMVARGHVMLKQYRDLAVQDLLYLQAELCDLQYDHAQQALADSQQQDFRRVYDREWWHLQSDVSRGGDGKQWQLALQIRSKLREYCKCWRRANGRGQPVCQTRGHRGVTVGKRCIHRCGDQAIRGNRSDAAAVRAPEKHGVHLHPERVGRRRLPLHGQGSRRLTAFPNSLQQLWQARPCLYRRGHRGG